MEEKDPGEGVFRLLMKEEKTNKTEKDSWKNRRTGGLQLEVLATGMLRSHREETQRVYPRTALKKSPPGNLLFGDLCAGPHFQKSAKKQGVANTGVTDKNL